MKYKVHSGQVSYGEAIGILAIENYVPFIPGDVANANSYDFPVRFERLPGSTTDRLFGHDMKLLDEVIAAGKRLVREGVRAITGDCGFLALFQNQIAAELGVPVFLSSLLQLDFIARIIAPAQSIGVVTANKKSLTREVLDAVTTVPDERLILAGLEDKPHFFDAVFSEIGELDSSIVEREVLAGVDEIFTMNKEMGGRSDGNDVGAILLECSLLPPYAAAVRRHTGLPVFDYNTMIRYVFQAVVPRQFSGFM
ncbi:MAG: aspartate/glutamate racemase family protein [Alkalispirochaeta sp.]|jgi:hypothetical protein